MKGFKAFVLGENEETKNFTQETELNVFNNFVKYKIPAGCQVTTIFGRNNSVKVDKNNKNKTTFEMVRRTGHKSDYEFTKEGDSVMLSIFSPGQNTVSVGRYDKARKEFYNRNRYRDLRRN